MYEPTHYVCFGAHCALMFLASHCCTTCREIRKLEKSQTVLLSGKLPTPRMEHGLPKVQESLREYTDLEATLNLFTVVHRGWFFI